MVVKPNGRKQLKSHAHHEIQELVKMMYTLYIELKLHIKLMNLTVSIECGIHHTCGLAASHQHLSWVQ